jgi:hypothetical protein
VGVLRRAHFTNDNESAAFPTTRSVLPRPAEACRSRIYIIKRSLSRNGHTLSLAATHHELQRQHGGRAIQLIKAAREGFWASECLIPVMIFGAELSPGGSIPRPGK